MAWSWEGLRGLGDVGEESTWKQALKLDLHVGGPGGSERSVQKEAGDLGRIA